MNKSHWQDWGSVLVGAWALASPWFLDIHAANTQAHAIAEWDFWLTGALLMTLAFAELSAFARWKEWCIAAIGTWLLLSPQLLGYTGLVALTWNAVICGLAVIALAGWAIGDAHEVLPTLIRGTGDLRHNVQSLSVPDEHEHMAGQVEHRPDSGPGILNPGVGSTVAGQTTKSI